MRYIQSVITLFTATTLTGLTAGSVLAAKTIEFWWNIPYHITIANLEEYLTYGENLDVDTGLWPWTIPFMSLEAYRANGESMLLHRASNIALNLDIDLDFISFERFLSSRGGECMLRKLATGVKKSSLSNTGNKRRLRNAFVNAAEDGSLNALEILNEYDSRRIHFNLPYLHNNVDPILKLQDKILASLEEGGFPVEQGQLLLSKILSEPYEEIDEDLQRFNLIDVDYDILENVSLNICERLDN